MNSIKLVFFAFTAFVVATGAHGENLACPQICPDNYEPICGTDGLAYEKFANDCEMNIFNCQRKRSTLSTYRSTDMDWCTTTELKGSLPMLNKELADSEMLCMKPCPMILRPVCGSNGTYRKTFSNDCEMEMFDCLSKAQRTNGWRLLKSSSCSN